MTSLSADRRGSTYVEFLVVVIPFVLFVLCVFQTALLEFADLVVERSANAAARSAAVVLDDDPAQYGGEQRNAVTAGGQREQAIRQGAANTLAALHQGDPQADSEQLELTFLSQPGADQAAANFEPAGLVTVRVTYRFRCIVPLARVLMCRDGNADGGDKFALINGEASLPNQGARYAYAGGGQ
jgi:Flp pilus assembly protein TadG